MNQVKLKRKDFTNIKGRARRFFLEKPPDAIDKEDFLCYCYARAMKDYFASKGWIMKNGFIYEDQKAEKSKSSED